MAARRYLCSELVTVRSGTGERVANLEEIWENGAVIESETPLEKKAKVQLRTATAHFSGIVTSSEAYEFGWRMEVEFSPLTPWTIEAFRPAHLLDPSELA